ncbi:MAG: NUDIX domain-containing protein [Nanoarchaeota archaeon]
MGMGDDILVVKKEILFKEGEFEGFLPIEKKNYLFIILNNFEYRERTSELEEDGAWQQPIPYIWIINQKQKKVFLYKRDVTGNEGRLYEKYSGGVGGHIDKKTEKNEANPVISAMMRELKEEVTMDNYPTPKIIGFINLREGVEEVHFGIVAVAVTEDEVKPAEDMASGRFYDAEEADSLLSNPESNVERWTQVSWSFIKDILLGK